MGANLVDNSLVRRFKWVLVIIRTSGFIEGSTRLQKIVFLVNDRVKELSQEPFYRDWVPGNYGPFSKNLANDLNEGLATRLIGKWPVKNSSGFLVDRFGLNPDNPESDEIVRKAVAEHPKIYSKIDELVKAYSKAPLMSLLHDVYYGFPQYASGSTIRAEVAARTGTADTHLSNVYDEPDE